MKIRYTRLPTGYHYAVAFEFHHLFIQWPVGNIPTLEHISDNGVDDESRDELLAAALKAATDE